MEITRKRWGLVPGIVSVAAVSAFALGFFDKAVAVSEQGAAAAGGPVVLEMFTSPGCSSWPPADALLSDIGSTTKNVIPLAYHVDYWNHLGWSDPFSSPKFSRRQSSYARAMDLGGGYTPQAVIEGSSQCVGSDGRSIWRAVDAARSASNLDRVNLHASLAVARPRTLRIRVSAQLSSGSATGNRDVMVAIFENGGREITYDYTVRKLVPAFELDSAHDGSVERQFSVDLDPHGHSTTSGGSIHSGHGITADFRRRISISYQQAVNARWPSFSEHSPPYPELLSCHKKSKP